MANQSVRLKEEQLKREEEKLREIEFKVQREIQVKRQELLAKEDSLKVLEARLGGSTFQSGFRSSSPVGSVGSAAVSAAPSSSTPVSGNSVSIPVNPTPFTTSLPAISTALQPLSSAPLPQNTSSRPVIGGRKSSLIDLAVTKLVEATRMPPPPAPVPAPAEEVFLSVPLRAATPIPPEPEMPSGLSFQPQSACPSPLRSPRPPRSPKPTSPLPSVYEDRLLETRDDPFRTRLLSDAPSAASRVSSASHSSHPSSYDQEIELRGRLRSRDPSHVSRSSSSSSRPRAVYIPPGSWHFDRDSANA